MKKIFFILLALVCSVGMSWAQQPVATASSEARSAGNALQSNNERWESKQAEALYNEQKAQGDPAWSDLTHEQKQEWENAADNQWWMVDYGTAVDFNRIRIRWEGAYAKTFTLEGSNDGTEFTVLYTESNQTSADVHIYELNSTAHYRYVKVNVTKRATQWGISFYEFSAYVEEASVLTTLNLTASASLAQVAGASVALTPTTLNQYGVPMDAVVTYTVAPAAAGHVDNGNYIADAAGLATVTAHAGSLEKSVTIFNYANDNIALSKTVTAEEGTLGNASVLVDGNLSGSKWDCSNTNDKPWKNNPEVEAYDKNHQSWALIDLGDRYDIEMINIYFDGACSHGYGIWYSLDGENFTEAYTYARNCGENHEHKDFLYPGVVKQGVTDHQIAQTNVRYIKYINTEMGNYGARLYEIEVYGAINQSAVVNVTSVTLNKTTTSIVEGNTETLVATIAPDNATNKAVTWTSSATNIATVDANGLVTAVYPGEATITAKTADGEFTATCVVTVTTDPAKPHTAAPVPTKDAENVIALYSDAYTCVRVNSKNSWGALPLTENTVLGDNYLHYSITKTGCDNGIEFENQDLSEYAFMHIDIWSEVDGTITLTLKNPNLATVPVKANQWKSFDLPLSVANLSDAEIAAVGHIKINQASAELKDHKIAVDNIYFWKPESGTDAITINATAGYATYACANNFTISGAEAYKGALNGNTLTITKLAEDAVIPAGEGILLKKIGGGIATITYTNDDATADVTGNALVGTLAALDASAISTIETEQNGVVTTLGLKNGEVSFRKPAGNAIAANKAYLLVPEAQADAPIRIIEATDEVTAIENVEATETVKFFENGQLFIKKNGMIYNAMGQRVK